MSPTIQTLIRVSNWCWHKSVLTAHCNKQTGSAINESWVSSGSGQNVTLWVRTPLIFVPRWSSHWTTWWRSRKSFTCSLLLQSVSVFCISFPAKFTGHKLLWCLALFDRSGLLEQGKRTKCLFNMAWPLKRLIHKYENLEIACIKIQNAHCLYKYPWTNVSFLVRVIRSHLSNAFHFKNKYKEIFR